MPANHRSDGRRKLLALFAVALVALWACDSAGPTGTPGTTSQASAPALETPAGSSDSEPTNAATPSDGGPPTASANPEPGPSDGSPPVGGATACSGSDENRDFYASMAAAVAWDVYCPVLPAGWFVDDGQYRLAEGGWMEISYDGPGEASVLLRQGMACVEPDDCVPAGQEVGETALGGRSAVLVAGDDGSWTVVADRGARPSWVLVLHGMTEPEARQLAADLHLVED